MNIDNAIEFVRANGSKFELERLNCTLGREFDRDGVLKGFASLQNPDGGFPYGDKKGFPSCMSNTTMALHTLLEMELLDTEPAAQGINFLLKSRKRNGIWEENPKIKPLEPPFWDMPGDEDTTTWLTAAAAEILRKAGRKVPKATFEYLAEKQGPDGRFRGFYHTTWIAVFLFRGNDAGKKTVRTRAIRFLEGADISDWDVSCIAWCLDSLKHGGVNPVSPLWDKFIDALSESQEEDGSWPSDGGPLMRVRDANAVLSSVMDLQNCG